MDPTRRQTLTTVSVIIVGSVLIVFDAPLFLLLLGTIATGLMMLVATGALRNDSDKGVSEKAPEQREVARSEKASLPGSKIPPQETENKKSIRLTFRGIVSTLTRALAQRQPLEPDKKMQKIDQMLDTLIKESPVPPRPTESARPSSSETGPSLSPDPLKDLSGARLNDDLLASVTGEDMTPPDNAAEPVPPRLEKIKKTNEGKNIVRIRASDLEDLQQLPEMEVPMDSLEGISIGELDPELEVTPDITGSVPASHEKAGPLTQPASPSVVLPTRQSVIPTASPSVIPPSLPSITKKEPDISPRGGGSRAGEDFMASLRSDIVNVRKPKKLNLLRDLKDENPVVNDLENELQDLSTRLSTDPSMKKRSP